MTKIAITLITLIMLPITSFGAGNPDCGPVTRISIVGDHDTDWVAGANIKLETFVRITDTNSPELIKALEEVVLAKEDDEDTKGFFVCLDEYETYYKNRQKFARVTKYRMWKDGEFISSSAE